MDAPRRQEPTSVSGHVRPSTFGKWYDSLLKTVLVDAKAHHELAEKVSMVPFAPKGELKVIGAGKRVYCSNAS